MDDELFNQLWELLRPQFDRLAGAENFELSLVECLFSLEHPQEELTADNLYNYLYAHGHFRNKDRADILRSLNRVVAYVREHQEPYNWNILDEQYGNNILGLYYNIKDTAHFDSTRQIVLITRIISYVYGCCPVFDNKLCSLLDLGLHRNDLSNEHIAAFKNVRIILYTFIILSYFGHNNLPDNLRNAHINQILTDLMVEIYEANIQEERERQRLAGIVNFNPNNN